MNETRIVRSNGQEGKGPRAKRKERATRTVSLEERHGPWKGLYLMEGKRKPTNEEQRTQTEDEKRHRSCVIACSQNVCV